MTAKEQLQVAIKAQSIGRKVNRRSLYLSLYMFAEHLGIESPESFDNPKNFNQIFSDMVQAGEVKEVE